MLASAVLSCQSDPVAVNEADVEPSTLTSRAAGPLLPLPVRIAGLSADKVALGRLLYWDKRLSGDGRVACSTCHDPKHGGANGERLSTLPNRPPVAANVPSIYNLAFAVAYAWNGRFDTIEEQIDFAMNARGAMASSWSHALAALRKDEKIQAAFVRAYHRSSNLEDARAALAEYTLSLVAPNARFDRYLRGELALSAAEQRGYELFLDYGCVSCHQGINIGGNLFQRFGVMGDYFAGRALTPADLGRYTETRREQDRHVFRVPSLRNVALTAPYFHDGSTPTLEEAVDTMARYQLGRELSQAQREDIVAFLGSLNGELPESLP